MESSKNELLKLSGLQKEKARKPDPDLQPDAVMKYQGNEILVKRK